MAPWFIGDVPQTVYLGDVPQDVYLGDVLISGGTPLPEFTVADANIFFEVGVDGLVIIFINTGGLGTLEDLSPGNFTFIGTDNGEVTLTGFIRVPNEPSVWSNAGQRIPITGITAIQPTLYTFANAGVVCTITNAGAIICETTNLPNDGISTTPLIYTPGSVARNERPGVGVTVPDDPMWSNAGGVVAGIVDVTVPAAGGPIVSSTVTISTAGTINGGTIQTVQPITGAFGFPFSITLTVTANTGFEFDNVNNIAASLPPQLRQDNISIVSGNWVLTITGTFPAANASHVIQLSGAVPEGEIIRREFLITDAGVNFSVNQAGLIGLSLIRGIFEGTNYINSQNIGTNNGAITLAGSIRVPNEPLVWTNADQLVTISGVTASQPPTLAPSVPTVRTDAASQVNNTNMRLNGTIVSDGNLTVTSRGFFWIQGLTTLSNTINNGTRVNATAGTTNFSAVINNLDSGTPYTFVAWAVNSMGEARATNIVTQTTATSTVTTTTDWVPIPSGTTNCTGGSGGTVTVGSYGSWTGADNIVVNGNGIAVSAECAIGAATCTVSRTRSTSQSFTGGSQSVRYECRVIVQGTTTAPNCSAPTGDGTTSTVGSVDNRSQSCNHTVSGVDSDVRQVPNTAVGQAPFGQGNIQVVSCGVAADGTATVTTNFGTTTPVNQSPSTGEASRTIPVPFSVSGTIPSGFEEAGVGTFSFTSNELAASPASCVQQGQPAQTAATSVSFSQASISFTQGIPLVRGVNITANGTWTIVGGGNAVSISPTSGNGNALISFSYNGQTQTRNGRAEIGGIPSASDTIIIDFGF